MVANKVKRKVYFYWVFFLTEQTILDFQHPVISLAAHGFGGRQADETLSIVFI